jgi:membrane protease YdiL (CAAX protease family)
VTTVGTGIETARAVVRVDVAAPPQPAPASTQLPARASPRTVAHRRLALRVIGGDHSRPRGPDPRGGCALRMRASESRVTAPRDPRSVTLLGAATLTVASVALTWGFLQGAVALQSLARGLSWEAARERVTRDALGLALVQAGAFASVLLAAVRLHARDDEPLRETLGLRPLRPAVPLLAFVAGAALQLPLAELANLVQRLAPVPRELLLRQQRLLDASTPAVALAAFVSFVVVAPLSEELLFRGVLLRGLGVLHGRVVALVASSALFALAHLGAWSALAYALVAGLVLGAVVLRTGSTIASIALHAGVNAVPVLVPARLLPIPGFNVPAGADGAPGHIAPALVVASAFVAALVLGLLARRSPMPDEEDVP